MTSKVETLARELGQKLQLQKWQLVTAESCTGGGLGYAITMIPGCSSWYERGFITYSNTAKIELLGVKAETIANRGAVSGDTAREMAEGALKNSHADIAVAITGIAGPDGGSEDKPVGTVWIAVASKNLPTAAYLELFHGDRTAIRDTVVVRALALLIKSV